MVDAQTKVCAVIANPVGHSLSPAIHNAAFGALELNFVYVAFEVADVESALAGVRALGIRGLSVTVPHKMAVIPCLDRLDPLAERIGAVNTIVADSDGRLTGYNTDGLGAMAALEAGGVSPQGKRVALLGSGGAARAIAFTLLDRGKTDSLNVLGIIPEQLERLVADLNRETGKEVGCQIAESSSLATLLPDTDILINATPVGMSPQVNETPVPGEMLHKNLAVFDIVYTPIRTQLLKDAEENQCQTVGGVEMFIHQAVAQFELWTGKEAPVKVMREVVLEALEARAN